MPATSELLRHCADIHFAFRAQINCNFAGFFPVGRPDLLSYIRSSENHTQEYLNNLLAEVARAGETLDTRSRFISFGNRMFLIRNLLDLKMERYGMLILGVNPDRMFEPLNGLQESCRRRSSCGGSWPGTG